MKYRLMTAGGSISDKLYTLEDAKKELNSAIIAIVTPKTHEVIEQNYSETDAGTLTVKLMAKGADRAKVIAIVDGYGDAIDWNYHSLDSIIAEVWQSDLNSGDEPDGWIINEICRTFNIEEVKA